MKLNLLSKLLFVMLLAFTVNSFIYFSFGNIYSSKILNYTDFSKQFHSGIYQYRILSGYFLIWIYDFLSSLNIDYKIFKLKFQDPNSEPQMYLSFYILNTIFMVLSASILFFITETTNFVATNAEKILIASLAIFAMAFAQFVIVPYDISSYFFLLLFFYFLLQYLQKSSILLLAFLMIIILISTLNRESSALSLSLAGTLLYSKFGFKRETFQPILLLGIAFIAVYFGMRFLNQSFSTNDGNLFSQNFSEPKNILGLLFWITFFIFSLIIAKNRNAKQQILIFHFLSLPYILMCFYTGIIYEIRLYVPLFLTSILLGRTELLRIH
ncbi:hypothetical protein IV494_11060 [Kaistella sp. G5-32]|uniref:EpsG-like glucosyltransferase n=1 Tax=Kaistella gelatinilytica TaxID=2787636 RepID=A0ABS0FDH8_9FLAO|nr:hypothetical protein [Kaistella gelatinilytica]MBF8457718.1 hypothetical protein [Kaistella gelatinilytica]